MSDYKTLQKWIEEGENVHLDFKTTITSPAKMAKNLVAFANCRGGKLVVGIEDKGYFVGVDVEGEKYELNKTANEFCTPTIPLYFEKIHHQGKFALVANVEESEQKPHYAINKKKTAQQLYVRIADECVVPPLSIKKMLENGEMNFTYRTSAYYHTQKNLVRYLKENGQITISKFAEWQRLSEHNAQRMLVDYLFEGILTLASKTPMVFALAKRW